MLQEVFDVFSLCLLGLGLDVILESDEFLILLPVMSLFLLIDLTGVHFGLLLDLCQVFGFLELSALHLVIGHLFIVFEFDFFV
jgi:hypothetical protein